MLKEIKYLINKLDTNNLTEDDITKINNLMFNKSDDISKGEIILVLGSSSIKRIEKAIEISKKYNLKILISGGNYLKKENIYEYEKYYIYCLTHDIKEENIILEKKSTNTLENIIHSLDLIKNNYKNIIVISSSQHILRVKLTIEKYLKEQNITNLNFFYEKSYATLVPKDNWYLKNEAKEIIKGELERILKYNLIN